MADLKPIGSEKLQGQEKLNRILEIARYKENIPQIVNETAKVEFGKKLSDGNQYEIVKEKGGYVLMKRINESLDYIEPMKNRRHYKSYSQALKRLNLMAGEINRLTENVEEVSMFRVDEEKKFTLKLPKPSTPEPAPAPEMSMDTEMDMTAAPDMGDEEMSMDTEVSMDSPADTEPMDMGAEVDGGMEEEVDFKVVQKITGKLGQKIRMMNDSVGMSSEDVKYVINSILSALDLSKLSEEDKEDILAKFEDTETDYDMDMDMSMDNSSESEFDFSDEEATMDGEMEEGMYGSFGNIRRKDYKGDEYYDEKGRQAKSGDIYGIAGDDFDTEEFDTFQRLYDKYGDKQSWFNKTDGKRMFDKYREMTGKPFKVKTRKTDGEMGEDRDTFDGRDSEVVGVYSNIDKQRKEMGETESKVSSIMDSIFSESKVDKVLESYFVLSESEIKKSEKQKSKVDSKMSKVKKLSETIEQELAAEFIIKENSELKLLGKTNKNNLVFESNGEQFRISPKGELL